MTNENFFQSPAFRSALSKAETEIKTNRLILKVLVLNGNDEVIREKLIDFYDLSNKQWLSKLIVWATVHHFVVELINAKDVDAVILDNNNEIK